MAKIIVAGNEVIVESSATLEDLKKVEKYRPEDLSLYNDKDEEIFRVGSTIPGKGSIGQYGASFGDASRNAGRKAIITIEIPHDVTDVKEFILDNVGTALVNINRVEGKIAASLGRINTELGVVEEAISGLA